MPATRELDVRTLPPPKRHPEIFAIFDGLAPDEAFILVNDHYPRPLLGQFQTLRPGRFEWNVLEGGPALFRVEIKRRREAGPRNVTEYLEADHARLDALVEATQQLAAAGSFDEARARFSELVCGLGRHIDVEEQVLFPTFEQITGMKDRGPTFVMRSEHVEIRRGMDAVVDALEQRDASLAEQTLGALTQTLAGHNVKEERMLYPMADRAVGDERAQDELVKRLQIF